MMCKQSIHMGKGKGEGGGSLDRHQFIQSTTFNHLK